MRKSLLAVAVLGAFAGSAMAADVTLYGIVDTGFRFDHVDYDGTKALDVTKDAPVLNKKTNNFSMKSGIQSGSRWGLKGAEELGNGYKVGFVLESGFDSDTGKGSSDGLFNRESTLWVSGGFGKVLFGRMGTLVYGAGSVSKIGMLSAFGTSWSTYVPQVQSTIAFTGGRQSNAIAYESPKFAGFVVRAQYGMGAEGSENKAASDRYAALSATYENGPLALFAAADRVIYGHKAGVDVDDSLTVTLGGNYDFGVAKVFGGAQYFDEVKASAFSGMFYNVYTVVADTEASAAAGADRFKAGTQFGKDSKLKGFGLNFSVSAPLCGGKAMAGVSYMDASEADSSKVSYDYTRYQIGVGYDYPLSKRTNLYAVASYGKDKLEYKDQETVKPSYASAMFGLRHKF